jgi:hypothetical protein
VAHIAHETGLGGCRNLCLLLLCVQEAQDKVKEYDHEQEIQDDVYGEVVVIDEIGEYIDMGAVGQEEDNYGQHQQGGAEGKDYGNVVLTHAEEKDHGHSKGEEVEIRGLSGPLHIAKEEHLEVGADDAEYFGELEEADAMEDHEEAEQKDAGQFDDGAPGHPVVKII